MMLMGLALIATMTCSAQRKSNVSTEKPKTMEQSIARMVEPEIKVFVQPKIAELQIMGNQKRQYYGPYRYPIKSPETLTQGEVENNKACALFEAVKSEDADAMVEPLFNVYCLDGDSKTLYIEISGFPAKYVNFRNVGEGEPGANDFEMIRSVYPSSGTKSVGKAIGASAVVK